LKSADDGVCKKEERKTVSCLNVRRGGIPRKLRDRVNERVILQHYPSECFLYLLIHNFRLYLHAELDKAFHQAIKLRYRCGFRYIKLTAQTRISGTPNSDRRAFRV
jgi:hypothetical protein